MFNNSMIALKKISFLLSVFLVLNSCKNDPTPLTFKDQTIERKLNTLVDISYPVAQGSETAAKRINKTIENFLANEINMSERTDSGLNIENAILAFDKEFQEFKEDFSDSSQQWEALIESEVTYESELLVCISVNSYLDTGGAHGNSRVTFLNFDKKTGQLLEQEDIIKDMVAFETLVKPYFEKASAPLSDEDAIEDPFYGEGFQLPENIGFGDGGIILLYNVYEIASYAQGVTEFVIPFEKAKPFLTIY